MSRSGKTAAASRWAAARPTAARAGIWDPQHDWVKYGFERVTSLSMLCSLLTSTGTETGLRLSVKLPRAQFTDFCNVMHAWGRARACLVGVEELAWVTSPGKAPEGWHELVTGGLKYGIDLVSTTQRPSESDKTALSQSTVVLCFQQERHEDVTYMAKQLRVDFDRVDALKPLDFLQKDRRTGELSAHRLQF